MKNKTLIGCGIVSLILNASILFAQSLPAGLIGCLDGKGDIFNIFPKDVLGEACPEGTTKVDLGTVSDVKLGEGLVGGVTAGTVDIGIDPMFAIPPACPPGQIALSDDNGGWVCTPPARFFHQNPTSKVWVLPHTEALALQLDQIFVRVLNPSTDVARVGCLYFDNGGRLLLDAVDISPGFTLGRGASDRCFFRGDFFGEGWVLVTSDVPVLATATASGNGNRRVRGSRLRDDRHPVNSAASWALQPYPIDCEDPTGVEFVCSFASQ